MSKFYDGNKILNLEIKPWNGSEYGCRMENDIFETAITGYDRETGMYLVEDAEGLIDYALDLKYGVGECDNPFVNPETIAVFVDGVEVTREGMETMKRIHIEFYGGESRYRNGAVNYMTVSPFETEAAIEALGDGADELYVETPVEAGDPECKGYNAMADRLAEILKDIGVDPHSVEWTYGSEADGSPKHIEE